MHGGDDLIGFGKLEEGVVEPDLDLGEVEGIVAQLDRLTAQVIGNTVAVAMEGKGGGLGDLARIAVQESLAKLLGVGGAGSRSGVLAKALERSLAGFGVELGVIDDLDPSEEGFVELAQGGDRGVS